jgi:hypothetical protein
MRVWFDTAKAMLAVVHAQAKGQMLIAKDESM